ncbi:MAG: hypothetical protein PHZ13_04900 [bacterium]|nr:hypothetical protein [bacterium]
MARPTREDSINRISIHKNGGYMYASTHPYTVTPEGKRNYSILHWGTVDKDMKFTPGSQYIYASLEERSKLIFPEDSIAKGDPFNVIASFATMIPEAHNRANSN